MNVQKIKNQTVAKAGFAKKDRILVVDDDRSTRELLLKLLSAIDYDVFISKDAYEALELLAERSFDIVLTDLEMPGMDGWQLAERVKEQAEEAHIILMTGSNEKMVMEKMNRSSVDAVIFKPFGLKEIREIINSTFELRTGPSTGSGRTGRGTKLEFRPC